LAPGVPNIQNPGVGMTGGGSVGGMPVTGMYFYHPDHLGSIQMITDGAGNPASGPEPGVSYVSYEPYGSINRNDSYGPDIFRYKFTGQIEDKDTGLYYYKSRYYEPILGRFLQADSQVMPTNVNGMNRYMYVDGNPVSYRDPNGHVSGAGLMHMVNRIVGHAMGKDFNSKGLDKRLSTNGVSTGVNRGVHNGTFVPKGRFYWDVGNTIFSQRRIGRWWVEFSGKSHVQNTANFAFSFTVTSFTRSPECKKQLGEEACGFLEVINEMIYQRFERRYTDLENPFNGGITLSSGKLGKFFEGRGVNCKAQKSLSTAFYFGKPDREGPAYPNGDGSIDRGEKEVEFYKTFLVVLATCAFSQDSE
ncbi:RHS repeat domain-containing protein, partial [Leptospira alexanderi]|uniref:RHS repeat domain-containing protein n=1 Tax=Leptospira alexanderi TaxID=100053 RepID=UPI001115839C